MNVQGSCVGAHSKQGKRFGGEGKDEVFSGGFRSDLERLEWLKREKERKG